MVWVAEDPAVRRFVSFYAGEDIDCRIGYLRRFMQWLEADPRLGGLSPSELVEFQSGADKKDQFLILDALQNYLRQKEGTYNTLKITHSIVKMFFKKNRASLPDDDFNFIPSREPVRARLSLEAVRSLVSNADPLLRVCYLSIWQGLMDKERFILFNRKYGWALAEHIKKHGTETPFLIEFPGRKHRRNKAVFRTFNGHDALIVWREYFERVRGWPKEGEAGILDQDGKALSKVALANRHLRLLEKLKYVKRGGAVTNRYGYGLHEFRDVSRTLLHLQGKKDNLDMDAVEHWMGHDVDPNKYNKFFEDTPYLLEQYRIAEKYLNIVSGSAAAEKSEKRLQEYELQIQNFKEIAASAMQRIAALEEKFRSTGPSEAKS